MQTDVEPLSAFLAPHINRERPRGLGQLDSPLGQVALAPDPDLRRIFFRERVPHRTQAQAEDGAFAVDDEIGRNRFAAQMGANGTEVITFTHEMGR